MSKIEKLIKELCPNGVEYKDLKELCNIFTGKLNANAMVSNGKYAFSLVIQNHIDKYIRF